MTRRGTARYLYLLEDRPGPAVAAYAALQHLLSMFVALVTPAIIICNATG